MIIGSSYLKYSVGHDPKSTHALCFKHESMELESTKPKQMVIKFCLLETGPVCWGITSVISNRI